MSLLSYSVNIVRRTLRHATKNTNRVRRHFIHRARYTSAGRAMLAVSDAATSPRDATTKHYGLACFILRNRRPVRRIINASPFIDSKDNCAELFFAFKR